MARVVLGVPAPDPASFSWDGWWWVVEGVPAPSPSSGGGGGWSQGSLLQIQLYLVGWMVMV